jgi:hypothetical protein
MYIYLCLFKPFTPTYFEPNYLTFSPYQPIYNVIPHYTWATPTHLGDFLSYIYILKIDLKILKNQIT